MWRATYSRSRVRLALTLVGLPLAIWAINTGHRSVPLLLFITYLAAAQLISQMLPRPSAVPFESQLPLYILALTFRLLRFAIAAGFVAAVLSIPFGGFKGLPSWAVILILEWWLVGALASFWAARWVQSKAKHSVIKIGEYAHD